MVLTMLASTTVYVVISMKLYLLNVASYEANAPDRDTSYPRYYIPYLWLQRLNVIESKVIVSGIY